MTPRSRTDLRLLPLLVVLAAALLVLVPGTVAAQSSDGVPPLTRVEDNISRTALANGLEIIVVEDPSLPLVTIEMVVRNGAFTEPPEYDGLSHLYEHMFFKGNSAIPNQEAYLARQRELGMRWNGTTSTERVNYFFTLPADNWKDGMVFMRDAIRFPLFDQEELERERNVVLDELHRNESNPWFHLRQAVDNALWYRYPSHKNVIGDGDIIATATREKMLTMQQRYYVPNNAALFVAGAVEPAAVVAWAQELYGDWPRGADPFVEHPLPVHPPLEQPQTFVVVEQPVDTVTVTIAWHGPDTDRDVEATYAADVFSFIVEQPTSTFQKNLVDSGLTLGASLSYYTQKNVGPISLSFQTTPDKLEAALGAVGAELARFDAPDYYSDAQIATAKTLLEVSDLYSREKTSEFTHTLSFWWSSAGLDYYLRYLDNLRAVSRDDMTAYVQRYIQGKPRVVGVLVSPAIRESLGGLDEATLERWLGQP